MNNPKRISLLELKKMGLNSFDLLQNKLLCITHAHIGVGESDVSSCDDFLLTFNKGKLASWHVGKFTLIFDIMLFFRIA